MEESPSPQRSGFTDVISAKNALAFKSWVFCPGMLFGSDHKWWGGRGVRGTAHEGLDLLLYKNDQGEVLRLDENTRIPAIYDGTVVRVIDDYLGRSIFIDHGMHGEKRLITAFGHTKPLEHIRAGGKVKASEIAATIAGVRGPKPKTAPHLHITAALVPADFNYESLKWETIGSSGMIKLIDPLEIIGGGSDRIEGDAPECNDL